MFEDFITPQLIVSLLIIAAVFVIWLFTKRLINKSLEKFSVGRNVAKSAHLMETVVNAALVIMALVVILQVNGINVDSLLTGLGVTSIIVGFALQDILEDWIMGSSIMLNDYFAVGEVIKVGDVTGQVDKLNFKCTRLIDITTGNVVTISNREILHVEILSDRLDLLLPFSYECSVADREAFLKEAIALLSQMDSVRSCEDLGLQELGESCITDMVRLHVQSIPDREQTNRDALTLIRSLYEQRQMEIPYNKLDVNIKGNTAQ